MIQSMTGYASRQGTGAGYRWTWELRSVNGRGLDLRLRVPDWIEGLEPAVRGQLTPVVTRGNVSLSLRVQRDEIHAGLRLNPDALGHVIADLSVVQTTAAAAGVTLTPPSAAEILALRGVMDTGPEQSMDTAPLKTALERDLPSLIEDFTDMRASEGAALRSVLARQLHEVAELTRKAADLLETRSDEMAQTLRRNLTKVLDGVAEVDEARVAQELATIAVKSDVTEEIDRLRAHVAAALDLIEAGGSVGRKLDFLMQEFNREANTLCSKAQMSELTETGLALKVVIDQMREQVQNVE